MGYFGYIFLLLIMVALIYAWYNGAHADDKNTIGEELNSGCEIKIETNIEGEKKMEEKKGTRELFMETLMKIGCQYVPYYRIF